MFQMEHTHTKANSSFLAVWFHRIRCWRNVPRGTLVLGEIKLHAHSSIVTRANILLDGDFIPLTVNSMTNYPAHHSISGSLIPLV